MSDSPRRVVAPVMVQQVVEANPGYFVLTPVENEEGTALEALQTPVVAWALERDTYQPYPITLNGIDILTPCILRPDGKVDRLDQETFASIAEWLQDVEKRFPRGWN